MLSVDFDEQDGIVLTVADGLATIEQFDAYLRHAIAYLGLSRARHGRALLLVDAADNPVQARRVFARMREVARDLARPGDRSAIVLHSMLARLQIDQMADDVDRRFFADLAMARAWLLEPVEPRDGRI